MTSGGRFPAPGPSKNYPGRKTGPGEGLQTSGGRRCEQIATSGVRVPRFCLSGFFGRRCFHDFSATFRRRFSEAFGSFRGLGIGARAPPLHPLTPDVAIFLQRRHPEVWTLSPGPVFHPGSFFDGPGAGKRPLAGDALGGPGGPHPRRCNLFATWATGCLDDFPGAGFSSWVIF